MTDREAPQRRRSGCRSGGLTPDRCDPVADPHQIVDGRNESVLFAQCPKIGVAVVDRVPIGQRWMAVVDHRTTFVGCQQHAGFLVALADRGDRITDVTLAVDGVDLSTGKDVHATANAAALVRRSMKTSMPSALSTSRNNITVAAGLAGIGTSAITGDGNALRSLAPVLVWMDLEMTGLEPSRHVIVEIATLITDDDLNIIAEGPDLVVHQDDAALAEMDPVVVDMHSRSGLLDATRTSTMSLDDAGAQTLEFIKAHVTEARRVPLCGNSIGMDRRFLAAYLPRSRSTSTTAALTSAPSRNWSSGGIRG